MGRVPDGSEIIPPYQYITTPAQRDEAIAALSRLSEIAVDTEGDSLYSYQEKVSLIQISGGGVNYIFDPLLLDSVLPLGTLFENREILKIFHGADYDIVSLKRDFKFQIGPIFDTSLAARAIGIKRFSLQDLIEKYFQVKLVKKYQKSNWGIRPLTEGHLEYASNDTVYLERLTHILKDALIEKGRSDQVEEECLLMEEMTWNGKDFEPDDYLRIKGVRVLGERSQKVLRELVVVRDRLARERNCPAFKIISSRYLIAISVSPPKDEAALMALFPHGSTTVFKYLFEWMAALRVGMTTDVPLPKAVKRSNPPMTARMEKLLKHLKQWRNRLADAEGLEPAMILTANVLTEIVRNLPRSIEDLQSLPLFRQWQITRYGEALLKEIASWERKQAH